MSDKKTSEEKPVTLADYIPDEPLITPAAKKAARDSLSATDRARLEALERAVRETEPDAVNQSKKKHRKSKKSRANKSRQHDTGKKNKLVFWAIVVMLIVGFAMID